MSFKVIVAGGRDFNDYELLKSKLDRLLINKEDVEIVSAKAKGADTLGEQYSMERHIKIQAKAPQWDKYGQLAWRIRNVEMGDYADALVAFFDGKSKGTKHMIDIAKNKRLQIRIIYY